MKIFRLTRSEVQLTESVFDCRFSGSSAAASSRDLQRCVPSFPLSSFPPQSMDPYFRLPGGIYPPGSREA